ncbi:hypothetical protein MNB_SV-13-2154 [hydrothermal vent metagenome]|uniref:Uncharacterized protein n=1 Tax=hydrothermal vent metagenome TaxID=652676 RepID=A0A1W1CYZ4_9ZZZZ
MSEEKAEALRQISEIKNHLVDKQTFYPYNYNAVYVWSVVISLLTFVMIPAYKESIIFGTMTIFILITLGFVSEGMMTKKENANYDIEDCTLRQRFIMKNFMMLSFFIIVLSTTFARYELYIPIYLSWLFLISIGYFTVGYVLNIPRFSQMAQLNILVSIILLAMGGYLGHLVGKDSECIHFVQFYVVLGLAILPAIIAYQQKNLLKQNQEDKD